MAGQVESAHPQLNDLLNTAIEIENKGDDLPYMERRVLRQLDEKAHLLDQKGVRPSSSFVKFLISVFYGIALSFEF